MPTNVEAAYRAISGNSRLLTLRYVLDHPNSTVLEIADATGVSPASARVSLFDLENAGYVTVDVEGKRNGISVHYSVNRPQFVDDVTQLWAWIIR